MLTDQDSHIAMNAICHAAQMITVSVQQSIYLHELPSAIYKPKVYMDGAKWCALYGDNLQDGVCGFGDTPAEAVADFNNVWNGWDKNTRTKNDN